jgi:hypothetical protein
MTLLVFRSFPDWQSKAQVGSFSVRNKTSLSHISTNYELHRKNLSLLTEFQTVRLMWAGLVCLSVHAHNQSQVWSRKCSGLCSVHILKDCAFFSSLYSEYFSFVKFLYSSAFSTSTIYFCHILLSNFRVTEVNNLGLFSAGAILFWIGHILLRDRILKYGIEGKIEGKWVRGRRRKQLLDDLKETRGYWNWKRLHGVEKWIWKSLCAFRKTDCLMMIKGNAMSPSCTWNIYFCFSHPKVSSHKGCCLL